MRHKELCNGKVSTLPITNEATIKFTQHHHQLQVPFVVYADFECILQPKNKEVSSTLININEHIPIAYAYYIKCAFDSRLDKFVLETGNNSGLSFLNSLIENLKQINNDYLSKVVPIVMSSEEESDFQEAINCHICGSVLLADRVRDHCHFTGKFRAAAHSKCNLAYRTSNFIPVFFHNFTKYDSHLFVKELSHVPGEIKVIPINKEHYISLSKIIECENGNSLEIRFLDTFRFMSSSLDALASNLVDEQLKTIKSHFNLEDEFRLMRKKGVFPYEYLDSENRLQETSLPPREAFYSNLTETSCSEEDYRHALKVWSEFSCSTLKDYLELYLKTDVLLLTDVFENFRSICLKIYSLDPAHFYTTPSLSWEAMLKSTKIELELLTDIDMYGFIQSGIRGGLV